MGHYHGIRGGDFVNAIHFPRLNAHATFFVARQVLADIPSGRAWVVVAYLGYYCGLRFRVAQVRGHDFFVFVSHAIYNQVLDTWRS